MLDEASGGEMLPVRPDDRAVGYDDLPPYWQVREDKLGFISGLSVLDLIFNLGPEAVVYLDRLSESPTK